MNRCSHSWRPLLVLPGPIPDQKRLEVGFLVGLSRLDRYDACEHCDRISYVAQTRSRRRTLVDPAFATDIRRRADQMQQSIAEELNNPPPQGKP